MKATKAILLVNLGTPQSPQKKHVRKFLKEFLNDARVIDIPWLARKILVNLIIIPFRVSNSTKLYQKLWGENGSPIAYYLKANQEQLQQKLGPGCKVYAAMRYGEPSLKKALENINQQNFNEIVIIPFFPQYASSTSGSIVELCMQQIKSWNNIPEIKIVGQFYSNKHFISAFAKRISEYSPEQYDHIVFSYHGLPLRHLSKVHKHQKCKQCKCEVIMPNCGTLCYKATCYATTRLLVQALGLQGVKYTTTFQSRLSKNWLSPFTDAALIELAEKGAKKVLVVSPSFVADCLETIIEIGDEYALLFKEYGGKQLSMVESLNDAKEWIGCLENLVQ